MAEKLEDIEYFCDKVLFCGNTLKKKAVIIILQKNNNIMRHFTCLRNTNRRCLNGVISSCSSRNWSQATEKQRRASDLSTRRSHLLIHNKSFHSSDLHSSYRSKFDDNKIVGACSFPNERRERDIDPLSLAQWIWKQAKIPKGMSNYRHLNHIFKGRERRYSIKLSE